MPDSRSFSRNIVERIGNIIFVNLIGQQVTVAVQKQLAAEDAASRKTYNGYVVLVNAVSFGIAPHIPHGARQIECADLLRIGTQAVTYHKALITERGEPFRHVVPLAAHAAELKCAAGADKNRTLNISLRGIAFDVGNKIVVIGARMLVTLVIGGNIVLVP